MIPAVRQPRLRSRRWIRDRSPRPPANCRRCRSPIPGSAADAPRTIGALLAVGVVAAAMAPVWAFVAVFVWMMLARSVDRSMTAPLRRRLEHGQRPRDLALSAVSSPWHLVLGAVTAIGGPRRAAPRRRHRQLLRSPDPPAPLVETTPSTSALAPRGRRAARPAHGVVGSGRCQLPARHPQHRARCLPDPDGRAGTPRRHRVDRHRSARLGPGRWLGAVLGTSRSAEQLDHGRLTRAAGTVSGR